MDSDIGAAGEMARAQEHRCCSGKSKLWNICPQDLATRLNWFVNQVLFTQNESSRTTSPHKNESNVDLRNEDQVCRAACSLLWQQGHGRVTAASDPSPSPLLCPRKNLFCNNESRSRRNFLSSVTTSCDNFGFLSQPHLFLDSCVRVQSLGSGSKIKFSDCHCQHSDSSR